jgi:site-specific DNA recombinase
MKAKASKGYWLGGRTPFGYKKRMDGKLVIDPDQIHIVHKVFQMFAEGRSNKYITMTLDELYNLNYGEKNRWRKSKLVSILSNPIYNGYPSWGKTSQKEGEHRLISKDRWIIAEKQINDLVIIGDELWNKVQEGLKDSP